MVTPKREHQQREKTHQNVEFLHFCNNMKVTEVTIERVNILGLTFTFNFLLFKYNTEYVIALGLNPIGFLEKKLSDFPDLSQNE